MTKMPNVELVRRLWAARSRFRYHSRPGHGASRTRMPSGEAKALARADIEMLAWRIARLNKK